MWNIGGRSFETRINDDTRLERDNNSYASNSYAEGLLKQAVLDTNYNSEKLNKFKI